MNPAPSSIVEQLVLKRSALSQHVGLSLSPEETTEYRHLYGVYDGSVSVLPQFGCDSD